MEIIPEESHFIIHYERDAEVMSREEAKVNLDRFVYTMLALKECAEHGYTFQIDGVTPKGELLFSHEFAPDNYHIKEK